MLFLPLAFAVSHIAGAGAARIEQRASSAALSVAAASLTSKWFEGTDQVQIVEVTVANSASAGWLTAADDLTITASGSSITLVNSTTLKRIRPGQQAIAQLGVKNNAGVAAGASCSVTINLSWGSGTKQTATGTASGQCGFGDYTADKTSLGRHSTPQWYDDAKFGIFMHWGIYSIPAYGGVPPHESYAEWYWNAMHGVGSQTYTYHKNTYGENFNYDDFISNYTIPNFDAKAILQLVADSGAKYFVPVTKHHDGFADFDFPTSASLRSSVHLGPKRDILNELFTAAQQYQPQIRRGTYFSLPEWYNPKYKYSNDPSSFKGGPPTNPYTGKQLTYTGYVDIDDFIQDLQIPQMNALAYNYSTEMMWCDIGGPNDSLNFISTWFNWAQKQGRQVVFNNRCGVGGDFTTPEYATNSKTVVHKWESNRGMDPDSFGYNAQTPDSDYLTGSDIVHSLVDITSKNGNFLLDIGPKGDGSIPAIMTTGLQDAGKWVKAHGESIFATRYWNTTPGLNSLRYTTTSDAFYIHVTTKPSGSVSIPDPIPYMSGDQVTVVGGSQAGATVPVTANSDGSYTLSVSSTIANADEYAWTFKITY